MQRTPGPGQKGLPFTTRDNATPEIDRDQIVEEVSR
jgi:hypothetical protein